MAFGSFGFCMVLSRNGGYTSKSFKIAILIGKSGTLFPRSSPFFWSPGISQQLGRSHSSLVQIEDLLGEPRKIFVTEAEALFGVPASLRQLRQRLGIVRVRPIFLRKTMVIDGGVQTCCSQSFLSMTHIDTETLGLFGHIGWSLVAVFDHVLSGVEERLRGILQDVMQHRLTTIVLDGQRQANGHILNLPMFEAHPHHPHQTCHRCLQNLHRKFQLWHLLMTLPRTSQVYGYHLVI